MEQIILNMILSSTIQELRQITFIILLYSIYIDIQNQFTVTPPVGPIDLGHTTKRSYIWQMNKSQIMN